MDWREACVSDKFTFDETFHAVQSTENYISSVGAIDNIEIALGATTS